MEATGFISQDLKQRTFDENVDLAEGILSDDELKRQEEERAASAAAQRQKAEDDIEERRRLIERNKKAYMEFMAALSANFDKSDAPLQPGHYLDPFFMRDPRWFDETNPALDVLPLSYERKERIEETPDPDAPNVTSHYLVGEFDGIKTKFTRDASVAFLEEGAELTPEKAFFFTSTARANSTLRSNPVDIDGSPYNMYLLYLFSQDKKAFGTKEVLEIANLDEIKGIDKAIQNAAKKDYQAFIKANGLHKSHVKAFNDVAGDLGQARRNLLAQYAGAAGPEAVAGSDVTAGPQANAAEDLNAGAGQSDDVASIPDPIEDEVPGDDVTANADDTTGGTDTTDGEDQSDDEPDDAPAPDNDPDNGPDGDLGGGGAAGRIDPVIADLDAVETDAEQAGPEVGDIDDVDVDDPTRTEPHIGNIDDAETDAAQTDLSEADADTSDDIEDAQIIEDIIDEQPAQESDEPDDDVPSVEAEVVQDIDPKDVAFGPATPEAFLAGQIAQSQAGEGADADTDVEAAADDVVAERGAAEKDAEANVNAGALAVTEALNDAETSQDADASTQEQPALPETASDETALPDDETPDTGAVEPRYADYEILAPEIAVREEPVAALDPLTIDGDFTQVLPPQNERLLPYLDGGGPLALVGDEPTKALPFLQEDSDVQEPQQGAQQEDQDGTQHAKDKFSESATGQKQDPLQSLLSKGDLDRGQSRLGQSVDHIVKSYDVAGMEGPLRAVQTKMVALGLHQYILEQGENATLENLELSAEKINDLDFSETLSDITPENMHELDQRLEETGVAEIVVNAARSHVEQSDAMPKGVVTMDNLEVQAIPDDLRNTLQVAQSAAHILNLAEQIEAGADKIDAAATQEVLEGHDDLDEALAALQAKAQQGQVSDNFSQTIGLISGLTQSAEHLAEIYAALHKEHGVALDVQDGENAFKVTDALRQVAALRLGNAAHVTARSDLPEALRADILKLANSTMEYLQENRVPKNSYDLFAAAMKEHFADGDHADIVARRADDTQMNVAAQEQFTQEQRKAQEQAQKDDKKRQKNASNSAKPAGL